MNSKTALSPKHMRFVAEYLIDLNATRAYRTVYGVAQKIAEVNGSRLLASAKVAAAVKGRKAVQLETAELSAARILEELRRMALLDRTAVMACRTVADVQRLPPELRALVESFEILQANIPGVRDGKTDTIRRVRMVSKAAGIEMLAKHFKLLTEVSEINVSDELLARLDRGRERNAARGADRQKR